MNENLFGQWILYTKEVRKHIHHEQGIRVTSHPAIKFGPTPKKALLIGERWLQNGRTSYYGIPDEEGQLRGGFNITSTTHCLVVVTHPRRNPIRVAIEGAELLNGLLVEELM